MFICPLPFWRPHFTAIPNTFHFYLYLCKWTLCQKLPGFQELSLFRHTLSHLNMVSHPFFPLEIQLLSHQIEQIYCFTFFSTISNFISEIDIIAHSALLLNLHQLSPVSLSSLKCKISPKYTFYLCITSLSPHFS